MWSLEMRHFRTGKSDRIGWFGNWIPSKETWLPFSTTAKCIGDRNLILNDDQDPNKVIFTALMFWLKWVLKLFWSMVVIFTFSSSQTGFGLQRSVSGISINIWTMLALRRSCVSGVFINNCTILDLGLVFPLISWQYLTWAWYFHNEYPDNAGSAGEDWMALRAPSYWHVMLSRHTGDTQWGSTT